MVGLADLGDLAWEVEKIHNRLLEEERPVTHAVTAMIAAAESDFRGWIDAATDGLHAMPTLKLVADNTQAANGDGAIGWDAPAPPSPRDPGRDDIDASFDKDLAAHLDRDAGAVDITLLPIDDPASGFDFDAAANAGFEDAEVTPITPVLPIMQAPARPPMQLIDLQADIDELVPKDAADASAEDDDIIIGDVTLSSALFRILTDEADEHVATLKHEMSLLQADAARVPSPTMVRASQTLCGIHRTGGFPVVATTAKALEQV